MNAKEKAELRSEVQQLLEILLKVSKEVGESNVRGQVHTTED